MLLIGFAAIVVLSNGGTVYAANAPTAKELETFLSSGAGDGSVEGTKLYAAYQQRAFEPIWSTRPEMIRALLAALSGSGLDGIAPERLGLAELNAVLADARASPATIELKLTEHYLRYARALAQGRINPSEIEPDWLLDQPSFDAAAALSNLSQTRDVAGSLRDLLPRSSEYLGLRKALRQYEDLAAAAVWGPMPDKPLEPGEVGEAVESLKARLAAEGDLPQAQAVGPVFDASTSAAVRKFQRRHGLDVDGRVGRATIAAINISPAERAETIRLNLERWRSMPRDWPEHRVVVNVAASELTLYKAGSAQLSSRVIVGAPIHPSPVLRATIESVLFNPPWNVPTSIVRKEIQPHLRRDPGYLNRNHYVILGAGSTRTDEIDWRTTSILGEGWRLQQEPGAWNSLGRIKLELPNPKDVYLHDTPTRNLFSKSVRTLSHGCIRVDSIKELASALLGGGWSIEAIDKAVADGATRHVQLPEYVSVYLVYLTAFVDSDGTVEFRDDVYGRDRRLRLALAAPQTQPLLTAGENGSLETGCPSA